MTTMQSATVLMMGTLVGWFGREGIRTIEVGPEFAPAGSPGELRAQPRPAQPHRAEMFSAELLRHFETEYRRGWTSTRSQELSASELASGEQSFRSAVVALPFDLGASGGEDANDADALRLAITEGDGTGVLQAVVAGQLVPEPEELGGEWLDRFFTPRAEGSSISGEAFVDGEDLELTDGAVIRFDAGVFELDERRLRGPDRSTLPTDITIVGAGRDATLLTIGDISIRGDVERLTFRDITLDAGNDGLFDLRQGSMTLDMARVRLVRFDAGHGGCSSFSVRGGALIRARDCDFVGGYGTSPGSGGLFRGPAVARFEDCRFELLRLGHDSTGHILYDGCRFDLMERDPIEPNEFERILFESCEFGEIMPRGPRDDLAKDLRDLFREIEDR